MRIWHRKGSTIHNCSALQAKHSHYSPKRVISKAKEIRKTNVISHTLIPLVLMAKEHFGHHVFMKAHQIN